MSQHPFLYCFHLVRVFFSSPALLVLRRPFEQLNSTPHPLQREARCWNQPRASHLQRLLTNFQMFHHGASQHLCPFVERQPFCNSAINRDCREGQCFLFNWIHIAKEKPKPEKQITDKFLGKQALLWGWNRTSKFVLGFTWAVGSHPNCWKKSVWHHIMNH